MTNEDQNQQKELSQKNKSSKYPFIVLEDAISMVQQARAYGKSVTDAQLSGKQSSLSGSFIRKKASLGYYGLIEGKKNSMEISSLAEKIISPLGVEEKKEAIKEAFLKPNLFKQIFEKVEPGTPLDLEILGNLIVRTYGIQLSAKKHFLDVFIKSGIFAGLMEYADNNSKVKFIKDNHDEPVSQDNSLMKTKDTSILEPEIEDVFIEKEELQTVSLTLSSGTAKIVVPKQLSEIDVKKLIAQINILGGIFESK